LQAAANWFYQLHVFGYVPTSLDVLRPHVHQLQARCVDEQQGGIAAAAAAFVAFELEVGGGQVEEGDGLQQFEGAQLEGGQGCEGGGEDTYMFEDGEKCVRECSGLD